MNQYFTCETELGKFFVKGKNSDHIEPYAAEAKALEEMRFLDEVRVPIPYFCGNIEGCSFLIIEYIELFSHTQDSMRKLGKGIAKMHLKGKKDKFGFEVDNKLGESPQLNPWINSWSEFFQEYRIRVQLNFIKKKYHDLELVEKGFKLMELIPEFFFNIDIKPSFLHGDLWYQNTGCDSNGEPVVFDPASYYGHAEAELSIACLFGNFQESFFQAYHDILPKSEGFEQRQKLYKLYHLLNHYQLFGSSYRPDCLLLLEDLLKPF